MKVIDEISRIRIISHSHGSADPDPDPYKIVIDPQHCLTQIYPVPRSTFTAIILWWRLPWVGPVNRHRLRTAPTPGAEISAMPGAEITAVMPPGAEISVAMSPGAEIAAAMAPRAEISAAMPPEAEITAAMPMPGAEISAAK